MQTETPNPTKSRVGKPVPVRVFKLKAPIHPPEKLANHVKVATREMLKRNQESCGYCGVSGYIAEDTLLRLLAKGLKEQNLQITALPDMPEGTPYGLIQPLMLALRRKGISII